MLRNISAAPSPVEQSAPVVIRNGPSRSTRDDDNNNFSDALRGAHKDTQNDGDKADRPASANKTETKSASTKTAPKEDAPRKRSDKDEGADKQVIDATALPPPVPQPKASPLTAIFNLISYQQPAQSDAPPAPQQPSSTVASGVAIAEPEAPGSAIAATAATPATSLGDVKAAAPTTGKAQASDRPRSMAVPLDYYPILQAGMGWGPQTPVAAAATANAGTATATAPAFNATTTSGKNDPLILNTPPAPEAPAPDLSPKTMAFAMRLGSVTPQAAKAEEPAPIQTIAFEGASVAALEQAAANGEKSQSGDTSSGHDSPFGAAYVEAPLANRSTSEKASFTETTGTAKTVAPEEITAAPANADPLRNILLQLKSDDNRRVDVRLVDRGGELHVAVKSADPVLAERLQEHIPELTSRLETEKFSHEVWMPKLSEAARSESGSSSDTSAGSDANSGQTFHGDAGRRQQGQSEQRPDWVDLLENQIG